MLYNNVLKCKKWNIIFGWKTYRRVERWRQHVYASLRESCNWRTRVTMSSSTAEDLMRHWPVKHSYLPLESSRWQRGRSTNAHRSSFVLFRYSLSLSLSLSLFNNYLSTFSLNKTQLRASARGAWPTATIELSIFRRMTAELCVFRITYIEHLACSVNTPCCVLLLII